MADEIIHKRVQEVKNDISMDVEFKYIQKNNRAVFNIKFELGCYAGI